MKTRIALIIAILAGLTATGLNFFKVREKITNLQSKLEKQTAFRFRAETDLGQAKADFEKASAALRHATVSLENVTAEKEAAVANATIQTKRAGTLADDLMWARQQRDDAFAELARYSNAITPEQAAALGKQIKGLQKALTLAQEENTILQKIAQKRNEVECVFPREVILPSGLTGEVVAFDPRWRFVVLNAGEDQGILADGELLVNRNGKLVAKVIVRRAEKNRCIANVMPGWELAEIKEGDDAIPAHPGS